MQTKAYWWAVKFKFHVTATCHEIVFFFKFFFWTFKNVKAILSSRAVWRHTDTNLQTPALSPPLPISLSLSYQLVWMPRVSWHYLSWDTGCWNLLYWIFRESQNTRISKTAFWKLVLGPCVKHLCQQISAAEWTARLTGGGPSGSKLFEAAVCAPSLPQGSWVSQWDVRKSIPSILPVFFLLASEAEKNERNGLHPLWKTPCRGGSYCEIAGGKHPKPRENFRKEKR